jgi:hypothetical protein
MQSSQTEKPRDRTAFKFQSAGSSSSNATDHTKLTYRGHDRQQTSGSPANVPARIRMAISRALSRFLTQITAPADADLPMRIGSRRR